MIIARLLEVYVGHLVSAHEEAVDDDQYDALAILHSAEDEQHVRVASATKHTDVGEQTAAPLHTHYDCAYILRR